MINEVAIPPQTHTLTNAHGKAQNFKLVVINEFSLEKWFSQPRTHTHTQTENKTVAASDKPSCDSLFFQFNRRKSQGKKYESVKVINGCSTWFYQSRQKRAREEKIMVAMCSWCGCTACAWVEFNWVIKVFNMFSSHWMALKLIYDALHSSFFGAMSV